MKFTVLNYTGHPIVFMHPTTRDPVLEIPIEAGAYPYAGDGGALMRLDALPAWRPNTLLLVRAEVARVLRPQGRWDVLDVSIVLPVATL